jgi:hypothetical protein
MGAENRMVHCVEMLQQTIDWGVLLRCLCVPQRLLCVSVLMKIGVAERVTKKKR